MEPSAAMKPKEAVERESKKNPPTIPPSHAIHSNLQSISLIDLEANRSTAAAAPIGKWPQDLDLPREIKTGSRKIMIDYGPKPAGRWLGKLGHGAMRSA